MISRCAYRERFKHVLAYDFKASKRPVLVYSTLNADTPEGMAIEMETLAKRSKKVEKPCSHFCFSLAPGEVLSPEQWAEFFAAVADEFGAMQAVGVTHADTPQVNSHLVMNRVRFDGRAWSTSNDRKRLRKLCTQYEEKFGLRILPENSEAPRVNKTEIEKADRLFRQGKSPTPIPARMALSETVRATLATSRTPDEFTRQLEAHGITVRWRIEDGVITGTSYACGEISVSGKNAGISVRAVREQFSHYERDGITAPGCPTPGLARNLEGAIEDRNHGSERSFDAGPAIFGSPERTARKTGRSDAYDRRDVAAPARPTDLFEILSDATRYGTLGLLGLLDLIIANVDRPQRYRRPVQRPRPLISLPL